MEQNYQIDTDKWNVFGAKVKLWTQEKRFPTKEQDFSLAFLRDEEFANVCCSNQIWITKLKKNSKFYVTELLLNKDEQVLQVRGYIDKSLITFRTKSRVKLNTGDEK